MFKEFKTFAMRGNVIDLAVGVIIGAAFGKVVSSLVDDIIMPPIGMAMGHVNFADKFISLNGDALRLGGVGEGRRGSNDQLRIIFEYDH